MGQLQLTRKSSGKERQKKIKINEKRKNPQIYLLFLAEKLQKTNMFRFSAIFCQKDAKKLLILLF